MGNVSKFLFISCAMAALLDLTQGRLPHLPDLNDVPPSPSNSNTIPSAIIDLNQTPPDPESGMNYWHPASPSNSNTIPSAIIDRNQYPPEPESGMNYWDPAPKDYCEVILMPEEQSQASFPLEAASSSSSSRGTRLPYQTYLRALEMMTSLNFPLCREATKTQKTPFDNKNIKLIVQNCINQSKYRSFQINSSQPHTAPYRTFEACFHFCQKRLPLLSLDVQMLVFLVNLCLKNIAFLVCIQPTKDNLIQGLELIEKEVKLTLIWLHDFLNSDGEVLNQQLARHFELERNAAIQFGDTVEQNLKIHEAGLVRYLLMKYYQSKNPSKWSILFGLNGDLLHFYVKFAHYYGNRRGPTSWENHWNRVQIKNSLPWKDTLTPMTRQVKGRREKDHASLFNYYKSWDGMMHNKESKKSKKEHK